MDRLILLQEMEIEVVGGGIRRGGDGIRRKERDKSGGRRGKGKEGGEEEEGKGGEGRGGKGESRKIN